jgi:Ca-activated chloride channel family protein
MRTTSGRLPSDGRWSSCAVAASRWSRAVKCFKFLALVLSLPSVVSGQAVVQDTGSSAVFRSATDLVALTVTVTDSRQQPIIGLNAGDFVVLEDGVPQNVSYFAAGEVPLDITLLVDGSASMRDKLDMAREAVKGLTRKLRPTDRISVVEFRDSVVQRQTMTEDRGAVESALNAIKAQGSTALYNAMYVALSEFRDRPATADQVRRQAIVVLSDGRDTKSLIAYEDVLEQARRRGVMVYVVALRSNAPNRPNGRATGDLEEGDYAMQSLARETGGQCFFPSGVQQLTGIYQAISSELGQQYALGYTSQNRRVDGGWRRVLVQLPRRPDARPRARSGYFAEAVGRVLVSGLRSAISR